MTKDMLLHYALIGLQAERARIDNLLVELRNGNEPVPLPSEDISPKEKRKVPLSVVRKRTAGVRRYWRERRKAEAAAKRG